jgi:DNA-directed RNA polymerase specialized sigma24 family protein
MMKSVAIDRWRRRRAARRGGGKLQPLTAGAEATAPRRVGAVELLALDEALTSLRERHPELFETIRERFFEGRSVEECSRVLGIDQDEVRRRRRLAVAWLRRAFLVTGPARP